MKKYEKQTWRSKTEDVKKRSRLRFFAKSFVPEIETKRVYPLYEEDKEEEKTWSGNIKS